MNISKQTKQINKHGGERCCDGGCLESGGVSGGRDCCWQLAGWLWLLFGCQLGDSTSCRQLVFFFIIWFIILTFDFFLIIHFFILIQCIDFFILHFFSSIFIFCFWFFFGILFVNFFCLISNSFVFCFFSFLLGQKHFLMHFWDGMDCIFYIWVKKVIFMNRNMLSFRCIHWLWEQFQN